MPVGMHWLRRLSRHFDVTFMTADWSKDDISDLKNCAARGITLEGAVILLGRSLLEISQKAAEIGLNLPFASREHLAR